MATNQQTGKGREHVSRAGDRLDPLAYQALLDAVGEEDLAKLWLMSVDTYGSEFSLDESLSLATQARKPDRAVFHEMPLLRPDTLYQNDQGGYSLAPICHTKSGLDYGR